MSFSFGHEPVSGNPGFAKGGEEGRGGGAVRLWWLGQAGFAICAAGRRILIDPYLSDSLAKKYRGQEFDYVRLMPAPIKTEEITALDYVFCSHGHTDHLDPETLTPLLRANPQCRVVAPAAVRNLALARGVPEANLVPANAGDAITLDGALQLKALASAHEELALDERGNHLFLGYVLKCGGITLYHSGDCTPYEGLAESLKRAAPDVALLPVNGRDAYRRERKILGNFTLQEALELCEAAGIRAMIAHHFGMFAFNTADPVAMRAFLRQYKGKVRCLIPEVNQSLEITVDH